MRLTENPDASFVSVERTEDGGHCYPHHPDADGAQGVMFECPLPDCGHMVRIWFNNPLNTEPAPAEETPEPRWERQGHTLDTLTIKPSIHTQGGCGWHGFVTNGEAK